MVKKILKSLLLLAILTSVQQKIYAPLTYAQYMLLRWYSQSNLLNQIQNIQILSPTPKGYNAALIAPALLPLQTSIDTSFQLLNHAQKAPDLTPDSTTLLIAPRGTEMNTRFHHFGTTEKK